MNESVTTGPIERRRLGRTGLDVSMIGLGGAWLTRSGQDADLAKGAAIVRRALAAGINYIDTAECYGESERAIGIALEGYSGDVILATKFGHVPQAFDFSAKAVLSSVRRSQERLRFRPIDLLQLHTPAEPSWPQVESAIEGMREARERGCCRYVGITGRDIPFLRRCLATGFFDTMLMFMRYDLLDQSGAPLIEEAYAQDVGVILGSPLRMGAFVSEERRRALQPDELARFRTLDTIFADEPGGLLAAAMRFTWNHTKVATVLSGVGSGEELETTLALDRRPLTPSQREAVLSLNL